MVQLVQSKGASPAETQAAAAIIANSSNSNKDIDMSLQGLKQTVEAILQS